MSKLAVAFGLLEPLRALVKDGLPGLRLVGGDDQCRRSRVLDGRPDQETVGGIDMTSA